MKICCLGSGSSGNCYILTCNNEKLILDCGLPIKVIKQGLDFDLQGIQGVLVTHCHKDHSLSADDFKKMGLPVFMPYEDKKTMTLGEFKVCAIPLTDLQGNWMHTNADRIREMSDEELAEFLAYNASCEECYVKKDDSCCYPDGTCKQKHLEWLQSEAEAEQKLKELESD